MEISWFMCLLILSILSVEFVALCSASSKGCFIKSIYSFGDSIADTGNLIRLGPVGLFAPIGYYPYGETFQKPTGRCSDGLLMIDHIALNLNLPLINPYLDKTANFDSGVNFAVAGSTALDSSYFLKRGIFITPTNKPLSAQLKWFRAHINNTCSSQTECSKRFEQTLFLLGEIGGNDYNNVFFQGRTIDEAKNIVPDVVKAIIDTAKVVIGEGAVQLAVPGNFPIGCSPSYLTMFSSKASSAYDERKCLKSYNEFSMYHNQQLQLALRELRKEYPEVTIMYADYYQAFLYLLDNAESLGFEPESLLKACCGAGGEYNFSFHMICGLELAFACSDPTKHISWDGIHLTQHAYKIMAESLIMQGFAFPNYNIQDQWRC